MKETKIYLIRHAEAEGNVYRRIHGQYDSNVTPNGRRQIQALEERFRDIPVDAVYASDLSRTVCTARAIAAHKQLDIHTCPEFREVSLGVWEDVPFGELAQTDPKQLKNFNYAPQKWTVPGAETYEAYTGRFIEKLENLARAHTGETIAVVSHGSVSSQSLKRLFPDAEICHMDNTAVSCVHWDGAFHLDFLGDNSHLSEEISTLAKQNWWRGTDAKPDINLWFLPYESEIDWYLRLTDEEIPVAPMAVIDFAMMDQNAVGIIQLDPQRDQERKIGVIDYLGLQKKYRGQHLGEQLLGNAVSYYRRLGRETIRMYLPQRFSIRKRWLLSLGFRDVGNDVFDLDIRVTDI